jgi:hypothetical protein
MIEYDRKSCKQNVNLLKKILFLVFKADIMQ